MHIHEGLYKPPHETATSVSGTLSCIRNSCRRPHHSLSHIVCGISSAPSRLGQSDYAFPLVIRHIKVQQPDVWRRVDLDCTHVRRRIRELIELERAEIIAKVLRTVDPQTMLLSVNNNSNTIPIGFQREINLFAKGAS